MAKSLTFEIIEFGDGTFGVKEIEEPDGYCGKTPFWTDVRRIEKDIYESCKRYATRAEAERYIQTRVLFEKQRRVVQTERVVIDIE